ncbi:MAG: hypothetical protein ACI4RT_02765 [Candidatus Spyradenecus sp.]
MKPFLWHNIAEHGTVAIPLRAESLPRILWSEIEELYPQLLPPAVRSVDPLLEPELITDSPFVIETAKDGLRSCWFQTKNPNTGEALFDALEECLAHWPDLRDLWEEIVHESVSQKGSH